MVVEYRIQQTELCAVWAEYVEQPYVVAYCFCLISMLNGILCLLSYTMNVYMQCMYIAESVRAYTGFLVSL